MSFGPESQLEKILADELDKEKISYTCQYRVYDRTNDLVPKYTLDFCIKASGKLIGIECDGEAYHTDTRREVDRSAYLYSKGIAVIDVKTVRRSIKRLKEVHLIEVVHQGCNKPNRIYVLKPEYQVEGENCPIQTLEKEVFLSDGEEIPTDREKCPANNTINYMSKDRDSFIDSKNEVEQMQEYVKELIGYEELISYDTTKDVKAIEVESVLENILNILVYEVFMADKEKVFNFGSKSNPDKKSVALIQSVFEKSLSRNVVKTYVDQFLKSSNPVNNALVYHIKGLYKQCLTQSSQYLSQGANMHRTYALP